MTRRRTQPERTKFKSLSEQNQPKNNRNKNSKPSLPVEQNDNNQYNSRATIKPTAYTKATYKTHTHEAVPVPHYGENVFVNYV